MYLLEHDAKTLLGAAGVPVPPGCLVESVEALAGVELPPGPWVVKAQVPVGGRGKAGLVKITESRDELSALTTAMLGKTHRGHIVGSCRIESCRSAPNEVYLGFMLAPETGEVRVLATASGGVEVETSGSVQSRIVAPELDALVAAVTDLASSAAEPIRHAMIEAGRSLGDFFLKRDAVLLEVNPLFVQPDGSWLAGDAKMVIDDNAITRQSEVAALLEARSQAYAETYTKYKYGFDYVVVDRNGELGLLTTGAGLSMMLIDELRANGITPYNFLDVRTGGLRGDASRLVQVLNWIAEGPNVKCVLVNVFAGITHLGEFSRLLVQALKEARVLKVPVVTRLVGNGLDDARAVLGEAGIAVEPDLDEALKLVRKALSSQGAGMGGRNMIDPRITRSTPVVMQGITGRAGQSHFRLMRAYGTNIVAGVSPRSAGGNIDGVPLFGTCAEAVAATGAKASIMFVGAEQLLGAMEEAVAAGVTLIVTPTEGMPIHDALKAKRLTLDRKVIWIGPSTPGMVVPGEAKLGFLPDTTLAPGPLGIMSKSGTLSYESGYRLVQQGIGQSVWVGVGGDPVKGVRFADLVPFYAADTQTEAVLIIGEIGGAEEEEFAKAVVAHGLKKPAFALIAGRSAPEGVNMGHAGALVHGEHGTYAAKKRSLEAAGVRVFGSLDEMTQGVVAALKR